MAAVFFLEKNLTPEQVNNIEGKLKESSLVLEVNHVTSEEAVNRFKNKFPELEGIVANLIIFHPPFSSHYPYLFPRFLPVAV